MNKKVPGFLIIAALLCFTMFGMASGGASQKDLSYDVRLVGGESNPSAIEVTIFNIHTKRTFQTIKYKFTDALSDPTYITATALLTDLNSDGHDDLALYLGSYGSQGAAYYACYLWDAKRSRKYKYASDFEKIMNPSLSSDGHYIYSSWRESAASHGYAKYQWLGGRLALMSELTENASGGAPKYTEQRRDGNTMRTTLKDVPKSGIDSAYWTPIIESNSVLKGRRAR